MRFELLKGKTSKGFGIADIFLTLFVIIIFFTVFVPVYQPIANTFVSQLDVTWQFYSIMVTLTYLVPLVIMIAIVLGIYNRAFPQYAPQGG